jgi:hypothetical protein
MAYEKGMFPLSMGIQARAKLDRPPPGAARSAPRAVEDDQGGGVRPLPLTADGLDAVEGGITAICGVISTGGTV